MFVKKPTRLGNLIKEEKNGNVEYFATIFVIKRKGSSPGSHDSKNNRRMHA